MLVLWNRLIRFTATDGRVIRGEPIPPNPDFDFGQTDEKTKLQAKMIIEDDIYDTTGKTGVSDEVVTVQILLGPLERDDVDILLCIGLNYAKHTKSNYNYTTILLLNIVSSTNQKIKPVNQDGVPPFPFIFLKPNTCVHDFGADFVISKIAHNDQADYEGELVLIIGKDAKDVKLEDALGYVTAYTAGNDISSRKLQREPRLVGGVPQWDFSKDFDTFALLGRALARPGLIGDHRKLLLQKIHNRW